MSAEHLLHLDGFEQDGYPTLRLTCEHDDKHDFCVRRFDTYGECWFLAAWQDIGREMMDDLPGPLAWPLPVKPRIDGEDIWLVKDEDATPPVRCSADVTVAELDRLRDVVTLIRTTALRRRGDWGDEGAGDWLLDELLELYPWIMEGPS